MTDTYATLAINAEAWESIADELRGLHNGWRINEAGEINMEGLALVRKADDGEASS